MVTGRAELHRRFLEVPENVRRAVVVKMEVYATQIVTQMRVLVPRESGDLAASIGWTWGDAPAGALTVGTVRGSRIAGATYGKVGITIYAGNASTMVLVNPITGHLYQLANLQEFGTVKMPANPFFYVTWRANKSRVKAGLSRAISKAVSQS